MDAILSGDVGLHVLVVFELLAAAALLLYSALWLASICDDELETCRDHEKHPGTPENERFATQETDDTDHRY
jgi:hypothetical protein